MPHSNVQAVDGNGFHRGPVTLCFLTKYIDVKSPFSLQNFPRNDTVAVVVDFLIEKERLTVCDKVALCSFELCCFIGPVPVLCELEVCLKVSAGISYHRITG